VEAAKQLPGAPQWEEAPCFGKRLQECTVWPMHPYHFLFAAEVECAAVSCGSCSTAHAASKQLLSMGLPRQQLFTVGSVIPCYLHADFAKRCSTVAGLVGFPLPSNERLFILYWVDGMTTGPSKERH